MELGRSDFEVLRTYVRRVAGIELGDDKAYLVKQRLEPVAESFGCTNLAALAALVVSTPPRGLREQVIGAITTNETSFFRDAHPFDALRTHVLPRLGEVVAGRRSFPGERGIARANVLSAGASTGQEAYSIAMTVAEHCRRGDSSGLRLEDVNILAADISPRVLERAAAGEYTALEVARGLSLAQRERHFVPKGDAWVARDELRARIQTRVVNFTEPLPFLGSFDVVFCRNMLIYFDQDTRRAILRRFHEMQAPGAFLLLGATESLYGLNDGYEALSAGDTILYRRV